MGYLPEEVQDVDGIEATIGIPMEAAEAAVRAALAEQGFAVLTEIDVAAIFRAKLGVDRAPLKILGACNADLAHQALEIDPSASLVLPCNVVLEADGDRTQLSIADPRALMTGSMLAELAATAAERLVRVRDAVVSRGEGKQ
ncbi:MAG TPA: DUF302 domain-containing protein [Candidatus Micrarchaeaceae archaeon]|nr:DUF302 domain-containing protein [Candidatus Micrarchaeaceae archaeon]